jgi:hypothetical protein
LAISEFSILSLFFTVFRQMTCWWLVFGLLVLAKNRNQLFVPGLNQLTETIREFVQAPACPSCYPIVSVVRSNVLRTSLTVNVFSATKQHTKFKKWSRNDYSFRHKGKGKTTHSAYE